MIYCSRSMKSGISCQDRKTATKRKHSVYSCLVMSHIKLIGNAIWANIRWYLSLSICCVVALLFGWEQNSAEDQKGKKSNTSNNKRQTHKGSQRKMIKYLHIWLNSYKYERAIHGFSFPAVLSLNVAMCPLVCLLAKYIWTKDTSFKETIRKYR